MPSDSSNVNELDDDDEWDDEEEFCDDCGEELDWYECEDQDDFDDDWEDDEPTDSELFEEEEVEDHES